MTVQSRERLEAFERHTDLLMLVLSVIFLVIITLPWFWTGSHEYRGILEAVEWTIWGAFAAELAVRVTVAPNRARFLVAHWFDVAIVVLPFLRPLRVLRALRAMAVFVRVFSTARRMLARRGLQYVLMFAISLVVASAIAVLRAESDAAESPISDFGDALWWAVTTVTTVGYGDTYPTTAAGRGIGVALMLLGIALFGVITANVAAFFVQEDERSQQDEILSALRRIEEHIERLEAQH